MAPLAVMALITGVLQAVLAGWGLLRYWWVTIKLAVTAALTLAVFLVLEPGLSAAAAGPGRPADAERLAIALAPIGAVTLGILNLALGIYKPRRRPERLLALPRRPVRPEPAGFDRLRSSPFSFSASLPRRMTR